MSLATAAETIKQSIDPTLEAPRVPPPVDRPYFRVGYVLGRLAGVALLIPALPIIAVLMVLVRVTSPGPGIYRQVRVGLGGKTFVIYKIRTMRQNAEVGTGAVWASTHDPRMTRLGEFLRRVHLDEFPQLFNVVKGEMSLIGPRPERPEFTEVLAREIPEYLGRLRAKPGITGLAQINLPPDTDLESVRRKVVLDSEYIDRAGPILDVQILCCTALRLLGLKGETCSRLTRLDRYLVCLARLKKNKPAQGKQESVAISAAVKPR